MIIKGNEFNGKSDVMFKKPSANSSGGKNVGICNGSTKKSLIISAPLMLTWGVNKYEDDKTNKVSYDMTLQFPNSEYNNEKVSAFLTALQTFETHIKNQAKSNSKEWLNKSTLSDEVIDALWTPMLKYPKDKDSGESDYSRPPTLRVKIPYWEGDFKMELYNQSQEFVFPTEDSGPIEEYIVKGSNIATLIQCGGVWFANGKFGVTWKLVQAVIKPPASLKGKCHIELSTDDKDKIISTSESNDSKNKMIEDSDDEIDEEELEPPPEPAPEPVPEHVPEPPAKSVSESDPEPTQEKKKKVVRKKKPEGE